MKPVLMFEADDGKMFHDEAACKEHETRSPERRLIGLKANDVGDAINRVNIPLADAIEFVGAKIRDARIAAGGTRRKMKKGDTPNE